VADEKVNAGDDEPLPLIVGKIGITRHKQTLRVGCEPTMMTSAAAVPFEINTNSFIAAPHHMAG
jgi:hypothetical protein